MAILCCVVFVAESLFWICKLGFRWYLLDARSAKWNITDTVITLIAVVEVWTEVVERHGLRASSQDMSSMTEISVAIRGLRFVRLVRLFKLARMPALADLLKMLVGFVVGIPSLLRVLLVFLLALVVFGIFGRMLLGPAPNQDPKYWTRQCTLSGVFDEDTIAKNEFFGDLVEINDDPNCRLALMYGEEFFGTVFVSMFTCFRFMLADSSTRRGVSLAVTFSQEFGKLYMCQYVAWMIVCMFGIFNIITAVFFVDTTVGGLKHNASMKKRAIQYEYSFVRTKLFELVGRIDTMNSTQSWGAPTKRLHRQESGGLAVPISRVAPGHARWRWQTPPQLPIHPSGG